MDFRNSDCVIASVDYVESVDSAVCGKPFATHSTMLFLTLEQVLVEFRVLECIDVLC